MAAEIWDLFDADGKKTGRTMLRGEDVPPGMYHIVVHIWPVNSRGEFLIQRRAETVSWKPGHWATTGGAAISGENALTAAIRELKEELGYQAEETEMNRIACLRRSNSFCNVYTVYIDRPVDAFVLQKEEVSQVKWCTGEELLRMVADNALYNYGDAYYKMLIHARRPI